MTSAFGIAGSQAAGSMEFLADGTWTKRLHPGWAACAGVHAAALARAGFRAPATIFEGRFGVLHALSDHATTAPLGGGGELELMRTGVKPHACCRYAQGPIDAVLALRAAHAIEPETVARVEVGLVAAAFPIICEPAEQKRAPASIVDMQFSLPFSVAVALARGSASPAEFSLETLADARVTGLAGRVEAVRDAELDARFPRVWPTWVRIHLRDGRELVERVTHPTGDPEHFLSHEALAAKFRRLAARSLEPASIARVESLASSVMTLAKAVDIADATQLGVTPLTPAR
jgi:2-methylcitrate dehydratase PrpD